MPKPDSNEPITVDGAAGEGGGQIVRTALSLSALTGRPLVVINVRAKRSRPGLQAQHLTAVHAAAALCNAETANATAGSTSFKFTPRRPVQAGNYSFDIGTAGATTLVAQTIAIPLALAGGGKVTLTGGTHVPFSPSVDFLEHVYAAALKEIGVELALTSERAGFYPKGGGALTLEVGAADGLKPVQWHQRGELRDLRVVVLTSGLPESVAARGVAAVGMGLASYGLSPTPVVYERTSKNPGATVLITGRMGDAPFGFAGLGEKGKPMEAVAGDAVRAFGGWWHHGAAVDEHLADQLVLPMSLADGESRWTTYPATDHLRTVVEVAKQFLPIEVVLRESAGGGEVTMTGAPAALRVGAR